VLFTHYSLKYKSLEPFKNLFELLSKRKRAARPKKLPVKFGGTDKIPNTIVYKVSFKTTNKDCNLKNSSVNLKIANISLEVMHMKGKNVSHD
jgi:hypothetical protein